MTHIEIKDCDYCNGTGKALGHDCPLCHGMNTIDKFIDDIISDLRVEVGLDIEMDTLNRLCGILEENLKEKLTPLEVKEP